MRHRDGMGSWRGTVSAWLLSGGSFIVGRKRSASVLGISWDAFKTWQPEMSVPRVVRRGHSPRPRPRLSEQGRNTTSIIPRAFKVSWSLALGLICRLPSCECWQLSWACAMFYVSFSFFYGTDTPLQKPHMKQRQGGRRGKIMYDRDLLRAVISIG